MGKEQDLLDASRNGQVGVVEKIFSARIKKTGPLTLTSLRRIPGPNTSDPRNGFTCLHYASLNGHKDIVNVLLENGANPNLVDHNGASPLHLASWTGDYEVVNLLLQAQGPQKIDLNLKNKDQETALHLACQYGHTAVVSLLLNCGSDPFGKNIRQETPLDLAAQYGRLETVELLLRLRYDLLKDFLPGHRGVPKHKLPPHSPLHLASRNGHRRVVKLLLELGFDVDYLTLNGSALHEAALCGKAETLKLLLEAGAEISLENDRGQKVDDLLNDLATPHSKQLKAMIREYFTSGRLSPDDSTTVGTSVCEHSEDLTLVDSMLQEDVSIHQNDFDLMDDDDDDDVQCISPPPGYCDFPIDANHHHLDIDRVSPASSVFSTSILSELASIFGDQLTKQDSGNREPVATEPFPPIKSSTSFTLADYRQQQRASATSEIIAHHQSFDASSFLNAGGSSIIQDQCSNMKHSNLSIVSGTESQSSLRPPKPPRKSICQSSPIKVKSVDDLDSDQSGSQHLNSVISNDKKKSKQKPSTKSTGGQLAKSIDDFYTLYDMVASGKEIEFENPPSPNAAENNIAKTIEPLRLQFDATLENCRKRSRVKSFRNTSPDQPRCIDDIGHIERRDISTLTDEQFGCDEILTVLIPIGTDESLTNISPKKQRSVAVWTVHERDGQENRSLVANRVQVKKKQLDSPRRKSLVGTGAPVSSRAAGDSRAKHETDHRSRNEHFAVYCETLKLDRKGEHNNPFAGLCRGGLTPAKSIHAAQTGAIGSRKSQRNDTAQPVSGIPVAGNANDSSSTTGNTSGTNQNRSRTEAAGSKGVKSRKHVELSEARKSLRRQRDILSGRAELLGKQSGGNQTSTNTSENEQSSVPIGTRDSSSKIPFRNVNVNDPTNIYATLRKKKKCKSLNGDHLGNSIVPIDIDEPKVFKTSDSCDDLLSSKIPAPDSKSIEAIHALYRWLKDIGMEHYKDLLITNGYDDLDFLDSNVMDDSDLLEIGIINASHREAILYSAQRLPKSTPKLSKAEIKVLTVSEWLRMLHLENYTKNFLRNGMNELRKIHNTGDLELDAVIEIEKSGYRRRILYSLSDYNRESVLIDDDDLSSWLTDVQSSNELEGDAASLRTSSRLSTLTNQPGEDEKRSWTGWKHSRAELVSNCVQYTVRYLGSTLVRELRGIDSTRASMAKLKTQRAFHHSESIPKIVLSINCKGVQFKDLKSNHLICEHEIRNIHCICQDSDDLNYFAYITKDVETNSHYCHVFMSSQTDLVTEIILTLGQAFEIAYQIVLEQYNTHLQQVNAEVAAKDPIQNQFKRSVYGGNGVTNTKRSNETSVKCTSNDNKSANDQTSNSCITKHAAAAAADNNAPNNCNDSIFVTSKVQHVGNGKASSTVCVQSTNNNQPPTVKGQTQQSSATAFESFHDDDDVVGVDEEIRSAFSQYSNGQSSTIVENKRRSKVVEDQSQQQQQQARKQQQQHHHHNHRTPTPPQRSASLKRNQHHQLPQQIVQIDAQLNSLQYSSETSSPPPPPPPIRQASRDNSRNSTLNSTANRRPSADSTKSESISQATEDIYAVVDKSRKTRKQSNKHDIKPEVGNKSSTIVAPEQKPTPPTRTASTADRKPDIKPKPPTRIASIQKPEVKPKPRTLQPGSSLQEAARLTPSPAGAGSVGRPGIAIKPSIAARQAALVNACSPTPAK